MHDSPESLDSRFEVPSRCDFERLAQVMQNADPLGLDNDIGNLIAYNDTKNTASVEDLLRTATARISEILPDIGPIDALASLRGFDFLISSLVAHGLDPSKPTCDIFDS